MSNTSHERTGRPREATGPEGIIGMLEDERDIAVQALERLLSSYRALMARKPVRDVAETIAEAEAALNWVHRG